MSQERAMLLEKLSLSSTALLSDLERRVGKPINLVVRNLYSPELGGQTEIENDGTPKITLNSANLALEELLVHELLHVVLRKDGFPKYLQSSDSELPAGTSLGIFAELMSEINESILHSIIYPRMEDMGLKARSPMVPLFQAVLKSSPLDEYNEEQAVVLYARVLLECESEQLRTEFRQRYEVNGWNARVEKGREIAETITSWTGRTQQSAVDLFIRCCNAVYAGRIQFQQREWGEHVRGSHTDKTVTIYIRPGNDK